MTGNPPPEVWLRGPLPGLDPLLMPAAHALLQAREDILRLASDADTADLWERPGGAAAAGYHLRHLAGSLDRRPSHYVVMAATPRFPDWYLYAPRLEEEAREQFIRQFAPLDPIFHIPNLSPAPILFQFGTDDFHVPVERAEEFFHAAQGPKELKWYDSGHGLNDASTADRKEWLRENLGLK